MPSAYTKGGRIHYQSLGAGPDIVMIHGLGANLAFWHFCLVPSLSTRFRITTYDLSGHGYSGMRRAGYSSADMANDLLELIDHIGIERTNLVGHSFGGAIALHFTLLAPERVETVTLDDAWVYSLQPLPRRRDGEYWERWRHDIRNLGVEVPDDVPLVTYGLVEEVARARTFGRGHPLLPCYQPPGTRTHESRGIKQWYTLLQTTSALADFRDYGGLNEKTIARIKSPVLLIYGEHSHCMPTCHRLSELLPDSKKVIVPKAGHFHPLVHPEVVVDHLTSFIEGNN
jgi:pimeloyl-ACP methyl ester carboxylesterase